MMARRDFEGMATVFAEQFAFHTKNAECSETTFDLMLGFMQVAEESNWHFDRAQFVRTIRRRITSQRGEKATAWFNRRLAKVTEFRDL